MEFKRFCQVRCKPLLFEYDFSVVVSDFYPISSRDVTYLLSLNLRAF